ncbi:InlB B-repeat-containing protein [Polaribacter marinaquae]|uniref:FG-GAP-like repeat-containing protein n=1 Tax=Polaribacter marinaquae TaxID=1642819 RepID=A0ABZ2TQW1_9FLAO
MKYKLHFLTISFIIGLFIQCSKPDEEIPFFTVSFSATKGGAVSSNGGKYQLGEKISVTAIPEGEYLFTKWSDENTNTLRNFTITSDINLNALFEKRKYPLIINIEGNGQVKEEIISLSKTTDYSSGTKVRLTAIPSGEWDRFDSWSGDLISTEISVELVINKPTTINLKFTETNMMITENVIPIEEGLSVDDISRTFSIPSGVFHYSTDSDNYIFFPGQANWISGGAMVNKEDVPRVPSVIFKLGNSGWELFKVDYEAKFWGARNYEVIDNVVGIGDGNEIGDSSMWSGDLFYGNILADGNINWSIVNDENQQSFFHGTCLGDINGDGITDIGGSPGFGGEYGDLNLYFKDNSGFSFQNDLVSISGYQPFAIDFADLDNDGIDEIVTATYIMDGSHYRENELNSISVYKFDKQSNKFHLFFKSEEPYVFYNKSFGATSIKCFDFDNDGDIDISVARERHEGDGAFEIWLNEGNTFKPHYVSKVYTQTELMFREFSVMDVNGDSFPDIVLRPHADGNLYRINGGVNIMDSGGVQLNEIIQINNGDGTFSPYYENELKLDGYIVRNVLPYMNDGILNFIGTFPGNHQNGDPDKKVYTVNVKIKI